MRKLLLLLCCYTCFYSTAQSKKEKNDSVCKLVQQYLNAKNADALYTLTGNSFKKTFSKDQFTSFCKNNLFPLDALNAQFESYDSGISRYKAIFRKAVLVMFIGLDTTEQLNTFLFTPYTNNKRKTVKPATNNPLQTLLDKAVDSSVQYYMSLAATHGLSIGILQNNNLYFYGYGETAAGSGKVPDKNTIFEIGSITKTFTAILLADAVNNSKIKLEEPLNKYLPDSIPPLQWQGTPVTIQMLSNHTSGISSMPANFDSVATDPLNPYKDYGNRQLFHFYKNYQLSRKPGSQYEYSNVAVATLGVILEQLYGKSFEQLVIEKICNPLRMNDTRQLIRKNDSLRVAKGYNEEGEYNGPWNFKSFAPAGSIRSTAADMLKYAKANMDEAPEPLKKSIQLTHVVTYTNGETKVGLGWHYSKPGKEELLWHNGSTGGYVSYLGVNKTKQFAIVILSNTAIGVGDIGTSLVKFLEKQ